MFLFQALRCPPVRNALTKSKTIPIEKNINSGIMGIARSLEEINIAKRTIFHPSWILHHLLPESGVARGEERILAGVPTQEMRRVGVLGMRFAACPNFMEQEGGGAFGGAVEVI